MSAGNGYDAQAKRVANDLMHRSLRRREETPIAFFCECPDDACFRAVWLTVSEYARARADSSWVALSDEHSTDRLQA